MRSQNAFMKTLLVALLAGVFQVNQQFTMSVPPTAAPANHDTRTIVPLDHPLEMLASQANSFLSLAAEYKTLAFIYPGDTAVNGTRLHADILDRFGKILYLSEHTVPNTIKAMLEGAFKNVMKVNETLDRSPDTLITQAKKDLTDFLKSKEKTSMEDQTKALTQIIENLRLVAESDITDSIKLQKILKSFSEIKGAVDISESSVASFNTSMENNLRYAQFQLNQTEASQRESLSIITKTHVSALGKARALIERNIPREVGVGANSGATVWASTTAVYFQPINDCPVDGKTLFTNLRTSIAASQTALTSALSTVLNPRKAILETMNTTLNGLSTSAKVTQAICANLTSFVNPRPINSAAKPLNSTLRPIITKLENLIFTLTKLESLRNTQEVTAHNTLVQGILAVDLLTENSLIENLGTLRGFDSVQYSRIQSLISSQFNQAILFRAALPEKIQAALNSFFPCVVTKCTIPQNYDFSRTTPLDLKNFVQTFKTANSPDIPIFDIAALMDKTDVDLNNEFLLASSVLVQTINQTRMIQLMSQALSYSNEFLRPVVDQVRMIEQDLVAFESQNNPAPYTLITHSLEDVLGGIRKTIDKTQTLKTQLTTTERGIKLLSLTTAKLIPQIDNLKTQLVSKGLAAVTSISQLACITPTPIANLVAPSASVVYRSWVLQFNHTNCFNVTNANLKELADAEVSYFLCPVDLKAAQYTTLPKVLLSTVKTATATATALPSNGVTVLPSANPLLINESTNNAADGTVAGKLYLKMNESTGSSFKEYTACVISLSKNMAIVKVTLPYLNIPQVNLLDGNTHKNLAQFDAYRQFYINVTTTAA